MLSGSNAISYDSRGCFRIAGRGLILIPDDPRRDFKIRAGTQVQLRTPDGRVVDTYISEIEMACGVDGCRIAFELPSKIVSGAIPCGTEIWYLPENMGQDLRVPAPVPAS